MATSSVSQTTTSIDNAEHRILTYLREWQRDRAYPCDFYCLAWDTGIPETTIREVLSGLQTRCVLRRIKGSALGGERDIELLPSAIALA